MGAGTETDSHDNMSNTVDSLPYAIRLRSYCRSIDRGSGPAYEMPTPLPTITVAAVKPGNKGPRPAMCPRCLGGLTGKYLTQIEEVVEEWQKACRPRKKRIAHGQLRRLPYRCR